MSAPRFCVLYRARDYLAVIEPDPVWVVRRKLLGQSASLTPHAPYSDGIKRVIQAWDPRQWRPRGPRLELNDLLEAKALCSSLNGEAEAA
jgi:hypothetical protein